VCCEDYDNLDIWDDLGQGLPRYVAAIIECTRTDLLRY
jgi:hypothetical protein